MQLESREARIQNPNINREAPDDFKIMFTEDDIVNEFAHVYLRSRSVGLSAYSTISKFILKYGTLGPTLRE